MEYQIKSIQDSIVDIEFAGILNASFDRDLASEVHDQLKPEERGGWLLADMQRVSFVDSSGVNQLLRLRRLIRESGGQVALHSLAPAVASIFEVLRLCDLFLIGPSRDAALDRIVTSTPNHR